MAADQLFRLFWSSVVDIAGAHNVIFAEVSADLDLNELEWYFAWVFQSVPRRSANVVAFTFTHEALFLAVRHPGGAFHDNPISDL